MVCYDLTLSPPVQIPLPDRPLVVALGNFDGVHIGHQSLLRRVCAKCADFRDATAAVWTFDPHPALSFDADARCLSTTEDRLAAFASAGISLALLENFTSVRELSPEQFVQHILRDTLHCRAIICGFNFHFGQGGLGNAEMLSQLAAKEGILCEIEPAVTDGDSPVSSTRIRFALDEGKPEEAARMLGGAYTLSGNVMHGRQVGRTLSLPTLNLALPPHRIIPAAGVYATDVFLENGRVFRGVTNIGNQPTFGVDNFCIETHLIDFEGDLYGSFIRVAFLRRLRDIRRFNSPEELRNIICADIQAARRLGEPQRFSFQ